MNIISLIPARGGSKGVPRKNIKLLNGKPLIYYSIKASNLCDSINKTYVTSEDAEILDISKNLDANIIERPVSLSDDKTSSIDVILHALDFLEENDTIPELFVLLQPTSPLRTSEDIKTSINLFINSSCDSLVSVYELNHQSLLSFSIEKDYLSPFDESVFKCRRQDLPKYYCLNGAIYITTPGFIRKNKSFISKKTIPYIMSKESSVDLDSSFDFKLAEFLLNSK